MKYLVTKKQVAEMYNKVIENNRVGIKDYNLYIYKDDKGNTNWSMEDNCANKVIYKVEDAQKNLFEWVVLKEIGGRRKYTKKELIDGIQWNITANSQL